MTLPSPMQFSVSDWKGWATRLIQELSKPAVNNPPLLPSFSKTNLPSAGTDGHLILVVDDEDGKTPAISIDGQWLRLRDMVEIS